MKRAQVCCAETAKFSPNFSLAVSWNFNSLHAKRRKNLVFQNPPHSIAIIVAAVIAAAYAVHPQARRATEADTVVQGSWIEICRMSRQCSGKSKS
jgi:hypothetical protein